MILDDKQYAGAKEKLDLLNHSIAQFSANEDTKHDQLKKVELDALKVFATQIHEEIEEFEGLRTGKYTPPNTYNFSDLPNILIKTRIARGWSQQKLAEFTHTKLRRLQLYEAELYIGASYSKKMQIAEKLGIDISGCILSRSDETASSTSNNVFQKTEELDWTKFPINEVIEKGWISKPSNQSKINTFKNWFRNATGPYGTPTFHRRKISDDENTNKESILTWEARVLQLAEQELKNSSISDFEWDERWLKDLARLTADEKGPILAKEALRQQGILLVIEKQLSDTYLDGAAMLSHEGVPIVAMTIRFDRLDYFWFTLFHELGHVYCHLYGDSSFIFFDQRSSVKNDETSNANHFWGNELEDQANKFALEKLINTDDWDTCLSRFSATEKSVMADAGRLGIHPSIIAGRIRNERSDFSILGSLIGQGMLYKNFLRT